MRGIEIIRLITTTAYDLFPNTGSINEENSEANNIPNTVSKIRENLSTKGEKTFFPTSLLPGRKSASPTVLRFGRNESTHRRMGSSLRFMTTRHE